MLIPVQLVYYCKLHSISPCNCKATPNKLQAFVFAFTDGFWSEWSEWDTCTQTCGGGTQTHTRTCTNPTPQFGGNDCGEDDTGTQNCNEDACPSIGNCVCYSHEIFWPF